MYSKDCFIWFSLELDYDSLLIFILGVDKTYIFSVIVNIHGRITGKYIFKEVENGINKKNSGWKNLKCFTDGGKNIGGKDEGVVALVPKVVKNYGGSKS